MKSRPCQLILLALLYVISIPINLWLDTPMFMSVKEYITLTAQDPIALLSLFFVTAPYLMVGIAAAAMKKWSWKVLIICLAWISIQNLRNAIALGMPVLGSVFYIGFLFLNLLVFAYFLHPTVRMVYQDSKLRWWESQTRYQTNLDGEIASYNGVNLCQVLDISEGGLFFQSSEKLRNGQMIAVVIKTGSSELCTQGTVIHCAGGGRYGLQFKLLSPPQEKQIGDVVRMLRVLGSKPRVRPNPTFQVFMSWLVRLLTTGKGLFPEFPTQRVE